MNECRDPDLHEELCFWLVLGTPPFPARPTISKFRNLSLSLATLEQCLCLHSGAYSTVFLAIRLAKIGVKLEVVVDMLAFLFAKESQRTPSLSDKRCYKALHNVHVLLAVVPDQLLNILL